MADELWLDILPALDGFGAGMVKGVTKEARRAGDVASKEYSKAFKDGSTGAADGAVKELETAQKRMSGLVQKLAGDVSRSRQAQQKSAADLITVEQRLNDAVAKYGAESSQAQAATLRLQAARSKAEDATSKFESSENALKEAQKSNKTITEQLTKAQSELGTEVKAAPGLWGKLSTALGAAGDRVKDFAKGTGGMVTQLAGAVGGAALLTDAFGSALEGETVVDRLNGALAATPTQAAQFGAATGNLYAGGFGESMDDVGRSVDSVVSSMAGMRNASSKDIEKITGYAMNLADAFDVDVAEAANTAGSLMKNGLAVDGVAAMDLITGAMTKVPAQVRGEILPIMDEYGKHFADLGIDGETAMGIIVASSQDGAIGMDKMGDALKEFTIRGTDMSKATGDAYSTLGLNQKDMTNQLLAGGDVAESAMAKIVHGLQEIKDPADQSAAAIALFGTPLEDLGTAKIPEFLGQIDPMGDKFDSMAGSAGKLGDTLADNTSTSLTTLKRSFEKMLSDGIIPALGPLKSVMDWAATTPGVMTAVAVALGVVALGWAAVTIAASPWLLVGIALAGIIGGIILVVKNWGGIMEWARLKVDGALNWISGKWQEFRDHWNKGMTQIGSDWRNLWNGVKSFVTTKWAETTSWVSGKWTAMQTWWKDGTASIGQQWKDLWGGAKNFVVTKWTETTDWISSKFTTMKTWWKDGTAKIGQQWKDLWGGAKTFVTTKWSETITWISSKFTGFRDSWKTGINTVKTGWSNGWTAIKNSVSNAWTKGVKPVLDSIGRGIKGVYDTFLKPMVDVASKLLKGDFVGAFDSAKKSIDRVWGGVANIVRKPINFVINTVYTGGIKKVFDKVAGVVKMPPLPTVNEIPAFAKGGFMPKGWKLVGEEGPELINTGPGYVNTAKETKQMLAGKKQMPMAALEQVTPIQAHQGIGGFWDGLKNTAGTIGGAVSRVWDQGINWVRGGLAKAAEMVINPIKDGLRGALGSDGFGGLMSGASSKLLDGAVSFLRGQDAQAATEGATFGGGYDGPLGRFAKPAHGPITSGFGTSRGAYPHAGIDFAVGIGSAVRAMFDGVIKKIGWNAASGRTGKGMVMDHGQGMGSYYGHLSNWVAQPGDKVKAGQVIAKSGNTGRSTGPHLHAELWRNGSPFNFASYLYDQGGILEPGFTPVLNKTKRPERVLTEPHWKIAERAIERTIGAEGSGDIHVTIQVQDLEGIRAVEEFVTMARRRGRQNGGN